MNITTAQLLAAGIAVPPRQRVTWPKASDAKPRRRRRFTGIFSQRKAWMHEQESGPGLFLPVKVISEANNRDHWRARADRASKQRAMVSLSIMAEARAGRLSIALPCVVTLKRYGRGVLDDDNLSRSMKACRDGVADAIGCDDNDPAVKFCYEQEVSRFWGLRIIVACVA